MPDGTNSRANAEENVEKGAALEAVATLFWERLRLAPAPLALVEKPLDQGAIGVWGLAVASFGVPMMAFLVVALRMGQAKIEEITGAAQAAWLNMFDGGAKASVRVEAQVAAANQAFANPEAIGIIEGGIGGGDSIFLTCRHRLLAYWAAL